MRKKQRCAKNTKFCFQYLDFQTKAFAHAKNEQNSSFQETDVQNAKGLHA